MHAAAELANALEFIEKDVIDFSNQEEREEVEKQFTALMESFRTNERLKGIYHIKDIFL